jgi:formate dehydrogenase subunit gamma
VTEAARRVEAPASGPPDAAVARPQAAGGELLRHGLATRVTHWAAALFFGLALLSGFAIYTPWLFQWLTPLFGGGARTRLLHPWFSLAFVLAFAVQVRNWMALMRWTSADSRWMGHLRDHITNARRREPDEVGFFNAGQKLTFWIIVVGALVFVGSGLMLWFPRSFGRTAVAAAYVVHDVTALALLVTVIVHAYEATAQQPGTLRAMIRGTVTRHWAWTHHPAWYREATDDRPSSGNTAPLRPSAPAASRGETG